MIFCFEKIYKEEVVLVLMKQFGYINLMEVLKFVKVILNMGVGEVVINKKILENVVVDMIKIFGQKLVVIKLCILVVLFKICDGWLIGCKIMLCCYKMYEFLDCLINILLLCVCDFCGVFGCFFDGRGNFNMGVKEQIIFLEIDFDVVDVICGMDIVIIIIVKIDVEVKVLLVVFKFLFCN